jgi:hypothetical protein
MYCATPVNLKVCSSVTSAVTANVSSCGTYKFIDVVVLTTNTTCTTGQMQLTTANEFALGTATPWNLSMSEGGIIAASILAVWALGWSFRQLRTAINGGSPE